MADEILTIREVAELLKIKDQSEDRLQACLGRQNSWLQSRRIVAVPAAGNRKLDKA
jgi:hypothetical protein